MERRDDRVEGEGGTIRAVRSPLRSEEVDFRLEINYFRANIALIYSD